MRQAHGVHEGMVFCAAQRQLVDVVSCYGCPKLIEIDLDSRGPKVVCAVPPPGEPAAG